MDHEQLDNYLSSIKKETPPMPEQKEMLKITLMNAKKSSAIGLVLVALPGILVAVVIIQHLFNVNHSLASWIDQETASLPLNWKAVLFFIFLVGFPLLAIVLNVISITYFRFDKIKKELDISIKVRWWNIIITIVGAGLACFYTLHILADSLLGGK